MTNKKNNRQRKNNGLFSFIKRINWNIGTVIFMALFLYMAISLILYLTADHVSSYQVTAGPLSKNETCTAMAIRQESLVTASNSGYVTYYTRDYAKVSRGGIVCGIGAAEQSPGARELTEADLAKIRTDASSFSGTYNSASFENVYDFKYSLENSLLSLDTAAEAAASGVVLTTSDTDGVVVYSSDGMEDFTEDQLTVDLFSGKSYEKKNLRSENMINAGDPMYRIVNNEEWSIVFPVTDRQTVRLAANTSLKVKFLKDGKTATGTFKIITVDEQRYGEITFTSGMTRYAGDRFLEVELVTNTKTGLKIPVSSIVSKEFYTIPETLQTTNDSNTVGFRREVKDQDGKTTTEFISATLYAETTDENTGELKYYIDTSLFQDGDILVNPETNIRYTVGETASLDGVYCINKGYAVFRKIAIVDQNAEFCIVDSNTSFGIAQYDYIAQDGSSVKEQEVLTTRR
ncbi:MAG: HlyD family efflux transporter periplasmic adaptor subunit [Lachnospiraceae bacterium]|nr:HlyD family efflux transporter periplasmic adaptor subunit [Lachnospiraceae bacterium]